MTIQPTIDSLSKFFRRVDRRAITAAAGAFFLLALPLTGCGGGSGAGPNTGGAAGTQDPGETNPFPTGKLTLTHANGSPVPHVVSSYYDPQLKINWQMTVFSGELTLTSQGTFQIKRKGGEAGFPVTTQGSGTYTIDADEQGATLHYLTGGGPARVERDDDRLLAGYVIKGGSMMIPEDVSVVERYELK